MWDSIELRHAAASFDDAATPLDHCGCAPFTFHLSLFTPNP